MMNGLCVLSNDGKIDMRTMGKSNGDKFHHSKVADGCEMVFFLLLKISNFLHMRLKEIAFSNKMIEPKFFFCALLLKIFKSNKADGIIENVFAW